MTRSTARLVAIVATVLAAALAFALDPFGRIE